MPTVCVPLNIQYTIILHYAFVKNLTVQLFLFHSNSPLFIPHTQFNLTACGTCIDYNIVPAKCRHSSGNHARVVNQVCQRTYFIDLPLCSNNREALKAWLAICLRRYDLYMYVHKAGMFAILG